MIDPLIARELTGAARRRLWLIGRILLVSIAGTFFAIWMLANWAELNGPHSGRTASDAVAFGYLSLLFGFILLGPVVGTRVLSRMRRERDHDFLILAGYEPTRLVASRLIAATMPPMLVILACVPATLLLVTYGGVEAADAVVYIAELAVEFVLVCALSMYVASLFRGTAAGISAAYVATLGWFVLNLAFSSSGPFIMPLLPALLATAATVWITSYLVASRIVRGKDRPERPKRVVERKSVVAQQYQGPLAIFAASAALLAAMLLAIAKPGVLTLGLVVAASYFGGRVSLQRPGSKGGQVWNAPVLWSDVMRGTGRSRLLLLARVGWVAQVVCLSLFHFLLHRDNRLGYYSYDIPIGVTVLWLSAYVAIPCLVFGIIGGGAFGREQENGFQSPLLLTPISNGRWVAEKIGAVFLRGAPVVAIPFLHAALMLTLTHVAVPKFDWFGEGFYPNNWWEVGSVALTGAAAACVLGLFGLALSAATKRGLLNVLPVVAVPFATMTALAPLTSEYNTYEGVEGFELAIYFLFTSVALVMATFSAVVFLARHRQSTI